MGRGRLGARGAPRGRHRRPLPAPAGGPTRRPALARPGDEARPPPGAEKTREPGRLPAPRLRRRRASRGQAVRRLRGAPRPGQARPRRLPLLPRPVVREPRRRRGVGSPLSPRGQEAPARPRLRHARALRVPHRQARRTEDCPRKQEPSPPPRAQTEPGDERALHRLVGAYLVLSEDRRAVLDALGPAKRARGQDAHLLRPAPRQGPSATGALAPPRRRANGARRVN